MALKVASAAAESASAERQLRREADALRRLGRGAGSLFPALLGDVQCHGRRCLALPILGPDLYSVQKSRGHSPFPLPFVWACARQLLRALEHLSDVELVHADIKPQNMCLKVFRFTIVLVLMTWMLLAVASDCLICIISGWCASFH